MPTSEYEIEKLRAQVSAKLRAAGFPVDQWQREHEERIAADPLGRYRPFTQITPPAYGRIKKLRPGFAEFLLHPAHGHPVARCQAAKKHTGGKVQCGKYAMRGKHLCRTHGGAVGSGQLTEQGRQNQIASLTVHGNETIEQRNARSVASRERKQLAKMAVQAGLTETTGFRRGPYYKPNRKGEPMAHLKVKQTIGINQQNIAKRESDVY